MLQPIVNQLNLKRIVLASSSPRRKELLKTIGLDIELCASTFEENLKLEDFGGCFSTFVEETAFHKVEEVSDRLNKLAEVNNERKPDILIAADTMVTLDGVMYGKPKSPQDAFDTLKKLMGKPNVVYTGVVIKYGDHIAKFTEKTKVFFGQYSDEQIQAYVDTGEPLDKAGSYGIQHIGSTLVEKIDGDFYTVMGLPLYRLGVELNKLYNQHK